MATPLDLHAFRIGEVTPGLFGRQDLARLRVAAATMRNMWVNLRGGAYSRAGFAFVGYSKQTGRQYPPRLIPFEFSIRQSLAMEFGHYYMRVISNGGYVTEDPFQITNVTQADPAVVTYASLSSAVSATANNGAVVGSYVRGDTIVIAGGTFVTPVTLRVLFTTVSSLSINAVGSDYAVNDTITLAGGSADRMAVVTVTSVDGSGGVTGIALSNGGKYTTNSATFTQASTSGVGTGATFASALFGPQELEIFAEGGYSVLPSNPVNQAATSGTGLGATFTMVWASPSALSQGDWVFIDDVAGMTQLNGRVFIVNNLVGNTLELRDVFEDSINSISYSAYTSGGSMSRIYTVATPYAEEDLKYLKYTQSADVMSLCCLNQITETEYAPQDLSRNGATDWTFSDVVTAATVSPPTNPSAAASSGGSVTYQYQVTSISSGDGSESIASNTAQVASAVNIAATAGTITITWPAVAGVNEYNIYKATPGLSATPPVGAQFGYVGSTFGNQFIDPNITPDFAETPPLRRNPFARGQVTGVTMTNVGSGYTTATITINSVTGSGAVLEGIIVSGEIRAWVVRNPGQNYLPTDTVTIGGSGGSGATGTLDVGPLDGTYPAVVAYFQQRRAYACTLNQPDTYEMSQPGRYTNFDRRSPPIGSDAITGTPWGTKVDGVQWMVPMPGGLVVLTGLSAWQVTGQGGGSFTVAALEPASQAAQQQSYNGISATLFPIQILDDIVYVQAHNFVYQNIAYQINSNIYTGGYLTLNSSHLFDLPTIDHCWCEERFKILWSIRSDGILRSFTYLKPEAVAGWARHDTQGDFVSCCSVTEPPLDALYVATLRQIAGQSAYMIERMDNRNWRTVEDVWAVDCGLSLPQPTPDATLSASSGTGFGAISGGVIVDGGTGYSAGTTATVVDDNGDGEGTGATVTLTILGGIITGVTIGVAGSGYTFPKLVISDPANTGAGADITLTLDNTMTFTTDAAVFSVGDVGSVIRVGGGIATITAYVSPTQVTGNITVPITDIIPNTGIVRAAASGNWSMTAPRTVITGLWHLIGAEVTGLADGNVIEPQTVASNGTITLPVAASQVTVGLGFTAQLQSVYLDAGNPTIQGQRKKIGAATVRLQNSRGGEMGCNQPDGSTLSPPQIAPRWTDMDAIPEVGANFQRKAYNATAIPLLTGDIRVPVQGGFDTKGQVAIQQREPLPLEVLSIIPESWAGDTPSQRFQGRDNEG